MGERKEKQLSWFDGDEGVVAATSWKGLRFLFFLALVLEAGPSPLPKLRFILCALKLRAVAVAAVLVVLVPVMLRSLGRWALQASKADILGLLLCPSTFHFDLSNFMLHTVHDNKKWKPHIVKVENFQTYSHISVHMNKNPPRHFYKQCLSLPLLGFWPADFYGSKAL